MFDTAVTIIVGCAGGGLKEGGTTATFGTWVSHRRPQVQTSLPYVRGSHLQGSRVGEAENAASDARDGDCGSQVLQEERGEQLSKSCDTFVVLVAMRCLHKETLRFVLRRRIYWQYLTSLGWRR